ncbi:putative G3BP-like protein [Tanacetum coccineum]
MNPVTLCSTHLELVDIEKFDESDTHVLERLNTLAGNLVKEILLKLNLPDHRILKDGGEGCKRGPDSTNFAILYQCYRRGSSYTDKKPNVSIAVTKPSPPVRSSALPSNIPQDGILDLKSIRVKDLPPKMTPESLVEVLKQFDSVKLYNI